MMQMILLILIVSSNCMKINCDEEIRSTETDIQSTEKADIHSADPESLQSKVTNEEVNEESMKARDDDEEIRISRSSSSGTTAKDAENDVSSKVHSAEASYTEKSAPDGVTIEKNRQDDQGVNQSKTESNQEEAVQAKTKSAENVQKEIEELTETSRSGAGIEDRKSMELLEASTESTINDYDKASSKINESDRTETEEIKDKLNESGLDENLPTRRMLSGPDYIVTVLDAKTNTDTTPEELDLEVKIVPNQNKNTYNFDEFGTQNNFKLRSPLQTELTTPHMPTKEVLPDTTRKASEEILEQQYLRKFYPQDELNMRFPNINSDFQAPRNLPIYLKGKYDELQSKNQFLQAQNSRFKYTDENAHFNPNKQRQHYQPQNNMFDQRRILEHKKIYNFGIETRNQVPQFDQNLQMNIGSRLSNKQYLNMYENYRNPDQQFNQDIAKTNYKRLGNLNSDLKTQIPGMVNTNTPYNNKELKNQFPYYPSQGTNIKATNIHLEDKQFGNNVFANAYPYIPRPNHQNNNLFNTLTTTNNNVTPKKIKVLFPKLPNTPLLPMNIPKNFNIRTVI